jgi:hypothetical protein
MRRWKTSRRKWSRWNTSKKDEDEEISRAVYTGGWW